MPLPVFKPKNQKPKNLNQDALTGLEFLDMALVERLIKEGAKCGFDIRLVGVDVGGAGAGLQ